MSDVPVAANVQALLERIDALPSPSALALRLVTTASDETSDVRDLVAIIQQDAALAAKVLSLCRRGPRGRALDVASLDRAVVLLGFGAVRAAALAVEFIGSFSPDGAMTTSGFDSVRFWRHSVAKSIVAEAASKFARGAPGAGRPSVVGLLHDLGALALSRALPALCDRCCDDAERLGREFDDVVADAVGLTASAIGARVAARWNLPEEITESLRMRGAIALAAQGPHRSLILLAQLADVVVRQRHVGGAGFGPSGEPLPPLLDALAIDATRFAAAIAGLFDDLAARTEALGLASPPGAILAAESLDRANRRLGLARHNPETTLTAISDELAAATDPASVLSCIVRHIGRRDGRPAGADARLLAVSPVADGAGCEVREFSRDGALIASRVAGEGDLDGAVTARRWCQLRAPTGTPRHLAIVQRGATLVSLYRADGDVIPETVLDQMPMALWAFALGAAFDRERARRAAQRSADAARLVAACRDRIAKDRALASVGELAAGLAHELNNPLTIASGRAQLLRQAATEATAHELDEIVAAAERASALVAALLRIARPLKPSCCEIDASAIIALALRGLPASVDPSRVTVPATLHQSTPITCFADPAQVAEALAEVVQNALAASASACARISAECDERADRCKISVRDDGPGFSERGLAHAVDPFFSERSSGRGTGLGLARARTLVEASGGSIELRNEASGGATVTVVLRRCAKATRSVTNDEEGTSRPEVATLRDAA